MHRTGRRSRSRSRSRSDHRRQKMTSIPRCRLVLSVKLKHSPRNGQMTWTVYTDAAGHWNTLKRQNPFSSATALENGIFDAFVTCGSCNNANSIDAKGIVEDIFTALRAYANSQNCHFASGHTCSFRSALEDQWQYHLKATSKGNEYECLKISLFNTTTLGSRRHTGSREETWIYKYSDASDVSTHTAGTWALANVEKTERGYFPDPNAKMFALHASLRDRLTGLGIPGMIRLNHRYESEEECRFCIQSNAHHLRWNPDSNSHRSVRDYIKMIERNNLILLQRPP